MKPGTIHAYRLTGTNLIDHFGKDKPLAAITKYDAKTWQRWLSGTKGLSKATAGKRTTVAKMIFSEAEEARHIENNPFAKLKGGKGTRTVSEISPGP